MKSLIICVSVHHGNTEKIGRAMADILGGELLKPGEVDVNSLGEYDLIGFGSGIYAGRHHKTLLGFVSGMPEMKDKKVFIFSTKGMGFTGLYHRALRKRLLSKGVSIAGEFSCKGFDTVGPFKLVWGINKGKPDEKDLKDAGDFARGLTEG